MPALRPESYHRSLKIGALTGYHPKTFTIAPPRVDRVIEKRLHFAVQITSGEISIPALRDISVRLSSLHALLRVFQYSLRQSAALFEAIDNIAAGNVRLALDCVKGFFGSGHVDTEKIVNIYRRDGRYLIPRHEFLRAVIFGDAEHFDPDRSAIANSFDVTTLDAKEHFLLPVIIAFLSAPGGASLGDGFVETAKVYERMQGLGFTPEQIDAAVIRAHNKKLLETAARRIPEPGQAMPEAIRVTSLGLYHAESLLRDFTYLDAVVVDTPILDPRTRDAIRDVHSIGDRLERARLFRKYLDEAWTELEGRGAPLDWPHVSTDLGRSISKVAVRASRPKGPLPRSRVIKSYRGR